MRWIALVFVVSCLQPPASADVVRAAADGFELSCKSHSSLSQAEAWRRLVHIERWWSPAHTYSGKAENLKLAPKPGGAWVESWSGGKVEHGRVVALMEPTLMRLDAALGPLQEMGVSGALTLQLAKAEGGGTDVVFTYRVSGASGLSLDRIAPAVNGVICEQAKQFAA